jgi:GxxExxY protein
MASDTTDTLVLAQEVFRIQGAVFEVYRTMGAGFLEAVYQECLAMEFSKRGIPFSALKPLRLKYHGRELKTRYAPDFICFESVILELKATREIAPEHRAQLMNYLRATGLRLGLLVNFGSSFKVQIVRIAL